MSLGIARTQFRARSFVLAALAVSSFSGSVFAENTPSASPGDKAAAEALFQQGLAALRAGKLEEACPKLEQSDAIEESIGTSLYLAECYEKIGKTASAWALFRDAASAAQAQGQAERAQAGREHADKLEPLLSKLTIQIAKENQIPGFEVKENGKPVVAGLYGVPVPVDAGDHRIEAMAPGHGAWIQVVHVAGNSTTTTVTVPPLVEGPPGSAAAVLPTSTATPQQTSEAASSSEHSHSNVQRTASFIVGGVGIVAVGIGTVFGVRAIAKNKDAKDFCPGGGSICTDQQGVNLTNQAKDAATLANVLVIGGAALAATGIVLYVTAPSSKGPAVGFNTDLRGARVTLGGAF